MPFVICLNDGLGFTRAQFELPVALATTAPRGEVCAIAIWLGLVRRDHVCAGWACTGSHFSANVVHDCDAGCRLTSTLKRQGLFGRGHCSKQNDDEPEEREGQNATHGIRDVAVAVARTLVQLVDAQPVHQRANEERDNAQCEGLCASEHCRAERACGRSKTRDSIADPAPQRSCNPRN